MMVEMERPFVWPEEPEEFDMYAWIFLSRFLVGAVGRGIEMGDGKKANDITGGIKRRSMRRMKIERNRKRCTDLISGRNQREREIVYPSKQRRCYKGRRAGGRRLKIMSGISMEKKRR